MVPSHNLLTGKSTYTLPKYPIEGVVLAKPGEVYAIHLPNASNTGTLNLSGAPGIFTKRCYNPRTGDFDGPTATISGGGNVSLGTPPSSATDDWALLIKKIDPKVDGFSHDPTTGDSQLSISGVANTNYKPTEADDLDFSSATDITLLGAMAGILDGSTEVTTNGSGDATVQFNLGTTNSANFIRAEEVP